MHGRHASRDHRPGSRSGDCSELWPERWELKAQSSTRWVHPARILASRVCVGGPSAAELCETVSTSASQGPYTGPTFQTTAALDASGGYAPWVDLSVSVHRARRRRVQRESTDTTMNEKMLAMLPESYIPSKFRRLRSFQSCCRHDVQKLSQSGQSWPMSAQSCPTSTKTGQMSPTIGPTQRRRGPKRLILAELKPSPGSQGNGSTTVRHQFGIFRR